MDNERQELIELRLTERVRERVESDLKRRYMWLGIVALVFTSGTVTLIVNSFLLDARIKLETARSLQETTTQQLSKAAEKVTKFANDAKKIEQTIGAGARTAEDKFSDLANRADRLANQMSVFSKDSFRVSQELRREVASLSKILKKSLEKKAGSENLRQQVETVLESLDKSEKVIQRAEKETRKFIAGYNDPLLGTWIVRRWEDVAGGQYKGSLRISARESPTKLRGLFNIVEIDGREVEQEMIITVEGERIHMEGKVTKGSMYYSRDVLDFTLKGDLMKGHGSSETGPTTQEIVLERALQSESKTPNKEIQPTQ